LQLDQGKRPAQIVELRGERILLGRHPNCQIVLDNAAVSRHHAQILESHGHYYLEDLRSRNHTYLNGEVLEGRTELNDADVIKVCDLVMSFHFKLPSTQDPTLATGPMDLDGTDPPTNSKTRTRVASDSHRVVIGEDANDSSSIVGTQNAKVASSLLLSVRPEAKLRAVLEISNALARTLDFDEVLQKILDGLFKLFPQAENGSMLLHDPQKGKLLVRATKSRRGREGEARISQTIVRRALETGEAILSADALTDRRFEMSESLSNLQIRSMMCVPLISTSDDKLGVLQIDTTDLKHQFSQEDLDLLVSVASQAALAVENAALHEEILKKRDIERDLEFAMQVQLGFLPTQRPRPPGYEFYDYYEAALRVGGDYFDYVVLPDERVAFALGDVAGKGMAAALLMARLYSSARYQLLTQPSASAALTGLNADIASSGLGYRFITSVLAILDPKQHTVTIANAGHMAPLWCNSRGEVQPIVLKQSGMPLGVVPDETYGETTLPLEPGDTIVVYTDGVTEAMNLGNDIYGREQLMACMQRNSDTLETLVKGIVADVEEFCGGRPQRDDVCLVCLRRSK
jgi:serine phosphatase RsbU (regulator of sigma subunit)